MATYTVIGSDQKQYDSVTADNIRSWITDGRLNAQSLMREENDTEFRPLSAFPEFVDAFAVKTSASIAPPHLPAAASAAPVKTSGMAISSLVLGILGMFTCGITALIGLILGIIAMVKVKNSGGKLGGDGIALGRSDRVGNFSGHDSDLCRDDVAGAGGGKAKSPIHQLRQ